MSRVVVAWKPRSANAAIAPVSSRRAAAGWTCSHAVRGVVIADTLTPCLRLAMLSKRLVRCLITALTSVDKRRAGMQRTIFGEDHDAFRASAKEYADRSLVPRMEQFLEEKTIERAAWLEAGKQGFLGLDVPEEYGGSSGGD